MTTKKELSPHFGAFGRFGGRYVSELLMPALAQLDRACREVLPSVAFQRVLSDELARWAGRPTPITDAPSLGAEAELEVWLKREDLLHGGAHKTNNVIGQALLARELGKTRLIAETGAGQHGVATAMAASRLGMEAVIYMGARDVDRQRRNVERMQLCGARVIAVDAGTATLKDAINDALRDWAESVATTHYLLGTVCGPDPFPSLVAELQAVIGREARAQFLDATGQLPDAVLACVGGGSNAIGVFRGFLDDASVRLIGAEAGGRKSAHGMHAASITEGRPGLLHGARSYVLQDADGQVCGTHSVAAGLDYPGIGPEHAALHEAGRAQYVPVSDEAALRAFELLASREGIVPALESAHALALTTSLVQRGLARPGERVLVNLSGRGDKDLDTWLTTRQEATS